MRSWPSSLSANPLHVLPLAPALAQTLAPEQGRTPLRLLQARHSKRLVVVRVRWRRHGRRVPGAGLDDA